MKAKILFRTFIATCTCLVLLNDPADGQSYQQSYQPPRTYQQPYRGQVYQPQQTLVTSHWAQQFEFGDRKHDFGAVPTASNQEHIFEFKNTLNEEIQLTGVRASCGCTKPKVLTPIVKPGETARILAKYDTLAFRGEKKATVTVSLLKRRPYTEYGEVQFSVKGKIRQDVVLNPGKISFDEARPNEESRRTVEVKYAGDSRWAIVDVKSTNPNIEVESRETMREVNRGRVDYELIVKLLKDQPIGIFSEQLTLITNDVRNNNIAVNVEGQVKAMIQAVPIKLGAVNKDTRINKKLVLRGEKAFRIKEILVDNQKIKFKESDGEKSLHILEYELDTSDVGQVSGVVTVVTDMPGHPSTTIPFSAQIIQPVAGGN